MINKLYENIPLHGGNIQQEAEKRGMNVDLMIDASASIIPFNPPKPLIDHLIKVLKSGSIKFYPDRSYSSLKKAIASWHKICESMVLPGNGAAELLTLAAREARLNNISVLPSPCFGDYERALKCWDALYIHSPLPLSWNNSKPQPFPIQPEANVIWVTNPHNPTGQLWSRDSLIELLNKYELVICDEAFISMVPGGEKESLINLTDHYKNLIVIRSLTKLFGIAGLRLGYVISNSKRLIKWSGLRDPWPVNELAINAGELLMQDNKLHQEWIHSIHKWLQEENPKMINSLKQLNFFKVHPTSTNFQLIESNNSLINIREKVAEKGILLRDCRSFRNLGDNWLRISLQTKENNDKIIQALKEVIL